MPEFPEDLVERAATHEANHCAAGIHFGWRISSVRIDGDEGLCVLERPTRRSEAELDTEDAIISMAGALNTTGTAWPGRCERSERRLRDLAAAHEQPLQPVR